MPTITTNEARGLAERMAEAFPEEYATGLDQMDEEDAAALATYPYLLELELQFLSFPGCGRQRTRCRRATPPGPKTRRRMVYPVASMWPATDDV